MKKITTKAVHRNGKLQDRQLTIGLDIGDRSSFYCVINGKGEVILEAKVATRPEALKKTFGRMPRSRIALETGTHSPWISRLLAELGHETIVAHARDVRLIGESRRKDDRIDAQTLAQSGPNRSAVAVTDSTSQCSGAGGSVGDPGALCAGARKDGADLCSQRADEVVRRTDPRPQPKGFRPAMGETLSPQLRVALTPLLIALETITERIREYDDQIEKLAEENYPEVALLKQVKGVGTLIALTYILTLEDPRRFRKSRDAAVTWDYSRAEGTPDRASLSCISPGREIPICAWCWCKGRNTSSARSGRTPISGDGD